MIWKLKEEFHAKNNNEIGGNLMFGTVIKYFRDKGYGFIRGNNGKTYFVHKSCLNGEYIDVEYYVFFQTIPYHKGR